MRHRLRRFKKMLQRCALLVVFGAAAVGVTSTPVGAAPPENNLFPQAYGILGRSEYLFPVDLGDWPLKVGTERQLFVDDFLVKSMSGLTRQHHQLKPHSDNPIYTAKYQPGLIYLVLRDDQTGKFRMWYEARMYYVDESGKRRRRPTVHIESDDGIHWRAPKLGVVEVNGNTENNYVFEKGLEGMFYEPWKQDLSRRFKGLAHMEPGNDEDQPEPFEGYGLYVSSDGIRWNRDRDTAVMTSLLGYKMPQAGIGDTVRSPLVWSDRIQIPIDHHEHVRLQFEVKNAKLYSFWVE